MKKQHVIDCDAIPSALNLRRFGFSSLDILEHRGGGPMKFDSTKLELFLSPLQTDRSLDGKIKEGGFRLREILRDKPVLNVNVLEYLLANPELIPPSWKKNRMGVCFWGTIIGSRIHDGYGRNGFYVRYLMWADWKNKWLDCAHFSLHGFGADLPAVLLKDVNL